MHRNGMDFVPYKTYISFIFLVIVMLYKHGIWRQCAITLKIVMAIGSVVSVHWKSLGSDIPWSFFFTIATLVHFICAEHRTVRGVTPDAWCKLAIRVDYATQYLVALWILVRPFTEHAWLLWCCIIATSSHPWTFAAHKHHTLYIVPTSLTVYTVVMFPDVQHIALLLATAYSGLRYARALKRSQLSTTSHACATIRHLAGLDAVIHIVEALLLWYLRCAHRFPHAFRWSPVLTGCVATVGACVWAHVNTRDTVVSRNSIIQSLPEYHFIATSLAAAKKCHVCVEHLTSLDMESSFR